MGAALAIDPAAFKMPGAKAKLNFLHLFNSDIANDSNQLPRVASLKRASPTDLSSPNSSSSASSSSNKSRHN
ncbi:hypothetical protein Tsubulata_043147 [Turnera subulata]|uniref:Uncharacterized protein n=1 Tax=Turnera subulata TaxID=218843 RepID=A0A9Q0JDJ6_9ROSI|nr:hypothetical protein Tsubulata_043147 [Turnera subulata]